MIDVPMRVAGAIDANSLSPSEWNKSRPAYDVNNILDINKGKMAQQGAAQAPRQQQPVQQQPMYQQPMQQQPVQQQPMYQQPMQQQPVQQQPMQQQPVQQQPVQQQPMYQQPVQQQPMQQAPQANVQVRTITVPNLLHAVKKGQKAGIENGAPLQKVKVCMGWNVTNPACDVDVSAFMLKGGKVIGDDWFVFYGQPLSPDSSVSFSEGNGPDLEIISIDFTKINPEVDKIVFVLTINEALEKQLNFGMLKDAYIRVMNMADQNELVSFMIEEYYPNVTSMMIGELYKHNGAWKFNAVGNGVTRDLAGLCELYGVTVDG